MNNFIKKIFGIEKIEVETAKAVEAKIKAEKEAQDAAKIAEEAKETAKQVMDKAKQSLKEAEKTNKKADAEAKAAAKKVAESVRESDRASKLTPKKLATDRKEPWIAVLDTHVNKDNLRNGFFELDWNEYFVQQLRNAGYTGETDEEIVDQWFKMLCKDVGAEEGIPMDRRGAGFINVKNLGDGRSEAS